MALMTAIIVPSCAPRGGLAPTVTAQVARTSISVVALIPFLASSQKYAGARPIVWKFVFRTQEPFAIVATVDSTPPVESIDRLAPLTKLYRCPTVAARTHECTQAMDGYAVMNGTRLVVIVRDSALVARVLSRSTTQVERIAIGQRGSYLFDEITLATEAGKPQ